MRYQSENPPRRQPAWLNRDLNLSPAIVFYETTQACDLVCLHCRASAQCQPHPQELSPRDALRLVDQLLDFPQPPLLVLTGGDPFKRPDLFDVVEHAARSGIEVSLTPSATPLVTPAAIRRLARAGVSRIAVSVDGADAATHDRHRGVPGAFQRALEILSEARSAGISTQVNTTLMPTNFGQIEAMADRWAALDITLWSVFFLVPVGRAAVGPRLTAEQYEQAFARLSQEATRRRFLIKTTEALHYRRYLLQHRPQSVARSADPEGLPARYPPMGLNDGKGVMFVSHTGLIHPSGFLPIVCGVFPLISLRDVYQKSPIFCGLRDADRLEGKCGRCEFRRICGGSRARAYALTGNPYAEEPDCVYQPRG
jgi:radical SAM protein